MTTSKAASSILLEAQVDESTTAYLLDPFVALLRGYNHQFQIFVSRPPSSPYIQASPSPIRSCSSAHAFASAHEAPKAKRQRCGLCQETARLASECEIENQSEAISSLSLKSTILAALKTIQREWIMECEQRNHSDWWLIATQEPQISSPKLTWLSQDQLQTPERAPNWADLTRKSSPSRLHPLPPCHLMATVSSSAWITYINWSMDSVQTLVLEKSNWKIYLPPRSGFTLATIEHFSHAVSELDQAAGWDAVIIDPPWQNKSAARGSKYRSIELYELFKLKLPQMLGTNGGKKALVAVWVTNRPKFRRFLKTKFLPDSHVTGPYAEWYWVKITASPTFENKTILAEGGQPIFDLESRSPRKCYEGLIVGWYLPASLRSESMSPVPTKLFFSVPLSHSRKPNIFDLLQPHLPACPNVLELFARTISGFKPSRADPDSDFIGRWHSVGDECPKFNGEPWLNFNQQIS
ncbi:hypothetical protein O181_060897 [Austropuccinia psidii MF-1]|uniref:MT-A70-domain-containing protein n=1 Tax=Austropuccinia psidii MF-1 TaxID=1389203 RepID=A0A9Q3EJK2_9BASI|nr:hypothetical protein [Austropuccinia psidii MF-1]